MKLRLLALFLLILFGACFILGQGPDYDLHFSRSVPSSLSADRINRNVSTLARWPQWFFSLEKASLIPPATELAAGTHVLLQMDPHKGKHRRYELEIEITQFIPNQILSFILIRDSSNKLTHLLSTVQWSITLSSNSHSSDRPTLIQGSEMAHTRHWRSRLFGKIAERIFMNQIFLINLLKLSELRQPFSVSPGYVEGGLTGPESPQ